MKQLRLFEEEREVQPQQRLATSCVVNSAFSEVRQRSLAEDRYYGISGNMPPIEEERKLSAVLKLREV
jgi:hypothetical protein